MAEMEKYYVFLSYSHADTEKYGKHHILNIKNKIEERLSQIPSLEGKPCVFLDADALKLGVLWNSTIIEKLNECKLFICLYSENYRKSEYCQKERLWWAYNELRSGRIRKGTLPIYYILLDDDPYSKAAAEDIQDIFAFQMIDPRPWVAIDNSELEARFFPELCNEVSEKVVAALTSGQGFCSVLPVISVNFVGRNKELQDIWDLCRNNRIPVIHAAGGVGKTELAVAYSYGHGEHYNGGRFMIPMEGVRTWGEAFKKMLEAEGTIAPSRLVPVWEQLKLPADLKEKELGEIHSAVWKKLQELAKNERILLLLDNVDNTEMLSEKQLQRLTFGPRIPDNIDIIATTRVEYKFGKNDNAVNYEIDTLDEKSAITMFGNICGNAIPCLQCPPPDDDQSEQSDLRAENRAGYSAMCAIVRLLENHPWSLEIVAGYLCQHYDNYDDYDEWGAVKKAGFQKKFAELQKDFQISEHEEASSWRNVDSVVKLLEPTINKLKETPAVFELACAAALLPPDCIPNFILIRYWNTFFPDVKFSSGNSFAEVMKMLQNYHIVRLESTFVKMHRLTASVLKDEIIKKSQEQSLILEKLNTVLLSISNEDWIKVLSHSPELLNSAPIENFSIIEIAKISHVNPKILKSLPNLKYCSTQILIRALTEQPAIADLLDEKIFFSGNDYVQLLSGTPQFANHSNLICEFISTSDWVQLLLQVPDMGINCPWDELIAQNWVQLLRNQPQFSDKCDWDKLDGADWCELLKEQPQFADKCNWEKLDKLGCSVWQTLLQEQPQFTDKCDWNKFDGNAWCNLLMELPQFADRCDWDKLNGVNWCNLLKRQPQFADKCDWDKLDGIDWCRLLEEQPQFANNCEVLVIFDEYKWCKILQKEPDLEASKYCDFNAFNGCLWRNLLSVQPQFADKCDWDKLDGADWCELLKEQPQFANICNWDKINSSLDWKCFSSLCKLLAEQPQFIYQCSCLELIDGNDWVQILKKQPQLANKCDWEKLDGADWCKLLMEQPQFADKCDWKKLDIHTRNVYGESAVCNLLISQPQLIDKINCLADFSSYEWLSILRKQPQLADKCDWTALDDLDDLAWRRLLEEQPQFADKCNWQKLDETYCVEFSQISHNFSKNRYFLHV